MRRQLFNTQHLQQYRIHSMRFALRVICLGITLIFAGCGGDDNEDNPTGPTTTEKTVTVPGNTNWTVGVDTGLVAAVGDQITLTASGTVMYLTNQSCGADGAAWTDTTDRQDPLWQQPHAALIGKIGESGTPFWIGTALSVTAQTAGKLFLGVNDFWWEGNTGQFTVTITKKTGA